MWKHIVDETNRPGMYVDFMDFIRVTFLEYWLDIRQQRRLVVDNYLFGSVMSCLLGTIAALFGQTTVDVFYYDSILL